MIRPSSQLFNYIYPVGSLYMSMNSTNPKELFGGEWKQIEGRFLFGVGSSTDDNGDTRFYGLGTTGGEFSHTLTEQEMPNHKHIGKNYSTSWNQNITVPSGHSFAVSYNREAGSWGWAEEDVPNGEINLMADTTDVGGNSSHNNMPPYLVVYMWQRIG